MMPESKPLLKHYGKTIALVIVAAALAGLYYFFDPSKERFFIACPLKTLTGYECAGCGSQRALHALLHFEWIKALRLNALFVLMLFLVGIYGLIRSFADKQYLRKMNGIIFDKKTIIIFLIIILIFSVLKNTLFYNNFVGGL